MPHFFITKKSVHEGMIVINDSENYNHIVKSLRAKLGEKLLFVDEDRCQYKTEVFNIEKNFVEVKILETFNSNKELGFELYLAQSPLRSDAQNLIVEKASELGVTGIYPVFTEYCVLKKDIINKKIVKWQKIMYEASKQCERPKVPICFELTDLQSLIDDNDFDRVIVFLEREVNDSLKTHLRKQPIRDGEKILVIIGPEGGFSPKEFEFFNTRNIIKLTLGNLILRAETAVVVALGNIIYEYCN